VRLQTPQNSKLCHSPASCMQMYKESAWFQH